MDASKTSEKDGAVAQPGADIELISNRLEAVKIDNKDEEENEILSGLTPEQRAAVEELQAIQEKHDDLERAYDRELVALKMKYEKLYAPLYAQRKERLLKSDPANPAAQSGTPAVPSFWMNCLKQNSTLAELVEEHDEPILQFLENISCEYFTAEEQAELEKKAGKEAEDAAEAATPESFRLVFEFSPNDFFTPNRLVKEYHLTSASARHGAELTSTKSTAIEWKEGKDVTKKVLTRKQRNKKTRQTRTVEEVVDNESFFNFFTDHEIPSEEKIETMSDKQIGELQMIVEADYDIGVTIRDKIIPQAVEWFLGEADDDEQFDDDFEDDEDDDDEMLSDEDDDSDEDEQPRRGGAGVRGHPRGKGGKRLCFLAEREQFSRLGFSPCRPPLRVKILNSCATGIRFAGSAPSDTVADRESLSFTVELCEGCATRDSTASQPLPRENLRREPLSGEAFW
ncbi:hypothetical protein NCLIV_018710 [Neospora caninum Liverpool]|uniref:Nucleosome assembly protein n=1 Tax=Neospora caninum (strain Liverpool) TaxID=572307 RepID=F0VED7_NEOCL|nr:hypothetical protein NCLIV_018710 [Neospora caninum Liverpool]CBZ52081.1 hypothetical protein NCLIV_018710 [Neospora caninum Liverpool]|eukprot:XP_003882113.1 hypothetical protein NCLIV_018710 [Neospora caninum Liverpool]